MPRAVVGWTTEEVAASQSGDLETLRRLLDPEFEVEGCFLLPSYEACARLGIERPAYESARNGSGPLAWNHHWLSSRCTTARASSSASSGPTSPRTG